MTLNYPSTINLTAFAQDEATESKKENKNTDYEDK